MYKFFDIAKEPRVSGSQPLYGQDGYFNYIPYEKIKKYTDIEEAVTKDGTVLVSSNTVKKVSCALIICTYKREEAVKRNVRYLAKKIKPQSDFECRIIVVDNARTLSEDDLAEDVLLIPNVNSGGSGGYRRGMEEAARIGGFTHFILMDDDVEIDFIAIQKCLNFLRFTKEEYSDLCISGSMLYADNPTYQFEAGGRFEKDGTQKGFGHYLDLGAKENLELNEKENPINYGGWWFMCMPFGYIEAGNYPLPFFIKYDDVEYALRCKLNIITLNGVGVWHEPFEHKYNSASEYYNTRNYLHLCSLYCDDASDAKVQGIVKKQVKAKLCRQQYKMAEAVIRGYEDFKKGLEWLKGLDAEENHRKISELNYKFVPYEEISREYGIDIKRLKTYTAATKIGKLKKLLPKRYAVTDHFFDKPVHYFLAGNAVHCNAGNDMGYVTERNGKLRAEYLKKLR